MDKPHRLDDLVRDVRFVAREDIKHLHSPWNTRFSIDVFILAFDHIRKRRCLGGISCSHFLLDLAPYATVGNVKVVTRLTFAVVELALSQFYFRIDVGSCPRLLIKPRIGHIHTSFDKLAGIACDNSERMVCRGRGDDTSGCENV